LRRLFQIIAFAVLTSCWLTTAPAQTARPETLDVLKQLLALPAPTPRVGEAAGDVEKSLKRPSMDFFSKENRPADDAPIADLITYWNWWANYVRHPDPSPAVVRRLLDHCGADPEQLANLLPAFPQDEATAATVKELYDKALGDRQLDREDLQKVRKWLVFNSTYFLNDLLTMANKVRDNEKGYVDQQEALAALAKVDWSAAEPLVQSLANGGQPRAATVALTLLYEHAVSAKDLTEEEKFRGRLQAIAANTTAPAATRDAAIEALSNSAWSGRDDWYLSLFHDETLLSPTDGIYTFSPLGTLVVKDPDKWIPVMAKLVESTDRTVRSAAAGCLILFQNNSARVDALRPLLPWLSNPDWVTDRLNHRLRLIQSMQNVNLPESVPGLIWVLEHDYSEFGADHGYAAQSLANYKDPRAIPALKKVLAIEKREPNRRLILQGLLACGGLSETEQVEALEAYAANMMTPEGRLDVMRYYRSSDDEVLPLPISIGMFLSQMREPPDSLLRAVVTRADALKKSNPAVAKSLLEVVHGWQGLQVDLDMVHRLADGSADAATIGTALDRREKLRESVRPELQALTEGADLAQGVAPVLLEDASLAQSVLSSGSESSQIALLACARLAQLPLPVDVVGRLLQSKNQLLALAAESYLLAEDSKDARELLWARHPKEAFVTGWRENIELMGGNNFEEMGKFEEKLRAELFKENPPVETIALLSNNQHHGRVLRVYADRAVYTYYENAARYLDRVITTEELSAFRQFIDTSGMADLGPQLNSCHYDCSVSELLILTKDKGRRVFSHEGFSIRLDLIANLDRLGHGENAKIHYNLEKEIKGLEVLYADEQLTVKDVWQGNGGIRIFVEQPETPEVETETADDFEVEDDEATLAARQREDQTREKARFSWRALVNGKAATVTAAPAGFSSFDESRFPRDDRSDNGGRDTQFIAPDSLIIAHNYYGLWRQVAGQKPVKISDEGAYASPIVTPDGKWIVAAKTDSHWGGPNYVVRFNLQTAREFRVNLPEAEDFLPIVYVAPHGRVLLRRARDEYDPSSKSVGPEKPEFYLLDAATGKTELTTGVFEPVRQNGKRFLQPTGKPNEFWAAIPNLETNQTRVGRYNLKDFSFQPLLVVPHISFDSMSLWVDEAAAKLFVVYEGQLVSIPLRNQENATGIKK
jgi:hypothetical protein